MMCLSAVGLLLLLRTCLTLKLISTLHSDNCRLQPTVLQVQIPSFWTELQLSRLLLYSLVQFTSQWKSDKETKRSTRKTLINALSSKDSTRMFFIYADDDNYDVVHFQSLCKEYLIPVLKMSLAFRCNFRTFQQKPHDYICSGRKNIIWHLKNVRFLLGHSVYLNPCGIYDDNMTLNNFPKMTETERWQNCRCSALNPSMSTAFPRLNFNNMTN